MTGPGGRMYVRVKRLGGAGDGGRDIEARYTERLAENEWDLYQAKRYRNVLSPTELFPDLAKVLMHLNKETYPMPRWYFSAVRQGHKIWSATRRVDLRDRWQNYAAISAADIIALKD